MGKVTNLAPLAAGWVLKGWSPVAVDDGQHVVLGDTAGRSVGCVVRLSGNLYRKKTLLAYFNLLKKKHAE